MSSTRDQRIRRAPSKSPKKSDKSKTGFPKASGSGSTKDTNFFTVTSTTTTSTYPANKLSLGGNLFAGSDFPMTAAFRGSSIDTDFGGQQISSVRVTTRLRNTKSLQQHSTESAVNATDEGDKSSLQNISETSTDGIPIDSQDMAIHEDVPPVAIYYLVNFQYICVITALLPLLTLFICFVTAYVFQYDEVHETHCRVYNIVPSISAITGVSPQRYFWRFSIAMHLGPRIPIAFVYKNYYRSMLTKLRRLQPDRVQDSADSLITLVLLLNCIEILSLGGVTYISNKENYPIHEKIFVTFMICSLFHMLMTIKLNDIIHKDHTELSQLQRDSIKWKKILFALSIISTIGLLVFFAKHRFYCHDLAFSWFAFFEYLIAIANMLFHFMVVWDFPTQHMLVLQATHQQVFDLIQPTSQCQQQTQRKQRESGQKTPATQHSQDELLSTKKKLY